MVLDFDPIMEWKISWERESVFNNEWISDPSKRVNGFNLKRKDWVQLNRIRTAHGCCNAFLFKWKVASSPACDCGVTEQTILHIVLFCPLRCFTGDFSELCIFKSSRSEDYLINLDVKL